MEAVDLERHLNQHAKGMTAAEKSQKSYEIIKNHVAFSLGAALIPLPGADLLAVSGVQLNMLRQLAKLYDVSFMDSLGKNIIKAVASGSAARVGASLVKAIPGVGTIVGEISMPVLSGASTFALGKVVAGHFEKGGTLQDMDVKTTKEAYKESMDEGKKVVQHIQSETPASEEVLSKIKRLSELKNEGIISEEEFQSVKSRLLAQI